MDVTDSGGDVTCFMQRPALVVVVDSSDSSADELYDEFFAPLFDSGTPAATATAPNDLAAIDTGTSSSPAAEAAASSASAPRIVVRFSFRGRWHQPDDHDAGVTIAAAFAASVLGASPGIVPTFLDDAGVPLDPNTLVSALGGRAVLASS